MRRSKKVGKAIGYVIENFMDKKFGAFSSCVNANKLALSVKGVLVGALPLAILIVNQFFQVDVSTEAGQLVETIGNFIVAIGGIISIYMTGHGLIRKILVKMGY